MENNERLNKFEEVVSEILIEMHQVNEQVKNLNGQMYEVNERLEKLETGQKEMIGAFNRFGDALLGKLDELTVEMKGMRSEMKMVHDHEARLRKLEEIVLRKGA